MRLTIFVLLLLSGPAALCQAAPPAPANPHQHQLTPPAITLLQPGRDFTKLPPSLNVTSVQPLTILTPFNSGLPQLGSHAQIDPQIVVHPPQSSLGEQPPGTQIAQNLYPGLQLLPIEKSKEKSQPLSTTWPNLKVQQIPITWPKCEIKPAETGVAAH